MREGTITKGIGGFYTVRSEDGQFTCSLRGRFRREGIKPCVGDSVKFSLTEENPMEGVIESIGERRNMLVRPPVANVDQLVVVISTTSPSPDLLLVDKLTFLAEMKGMAVVICVNKTDLKEGEELADIYRRVGYAAICTCTKPTEERRGIDELRENLKGKISVFAGNSAVGKSSLLNALGFELPTGGVSKIQRGRHTTRHVEIMPLADGFVIDTPGFSVLEPSFAEAEGIKNCVREFHTVGECRFKDCQHLSEEGCRVLEAVENGRIERSRYESYKAIAGERSRSY